MAVRGLMTGDLQDASLLHLLFLVRGHGSINTLFSIENGAQENMVVGGAGSIAQRVADELGDAVRLNAPVAQDLAAQRSRRRRSRRRDGVGTARHRHRASGAGARHRVRSPAARRPRDALPQRHRRSGVQDPRSCTTSRSGVTTGFSGQSSEPGTVSEVTLDATPASGRPGVIASFTFGPVAARVDELGVDERRKAVLDALTTRFGPKAASPVEFIETPWWKEPWTRGCSMAHLPPGYPHPVRIAAPRAVRTCALGRNRDVDDVARRHRRRGPLRRARRRRGPRPAVVRDTGTNGGVPINRSTAPCWRRPRSPCSSSPWSCSRS